MIDFCLACGTDSIRTRSGDSVNPLQPRRNPGSSLNDRWSLSPTENQSTKRKFQTAQRQVLVWFGFTRMTDPGYLTGYRQTSRGRPLVHHLSRKPHRKMEIKCVREIHQCKFISPASYTSNEGK